MIVLRVWLLRSINFLRAFSMWEGTAAERDEYFWEYTAMFKHLFPGTRLEFAKSLEHIYVIVGTDNVDKLNML